MWPDTASCIPALPCAMLIDTMPVNSKGLKIFYDWVPGGEAQWSGDTIAVLGYKPEDLSGQWFEIIHREDYPAFEKLLRESMISEKPFSHEYRVRVHGGIYKKVQDYGDYILDKAGNIERMKGWIMVV